MEPHSQVPATCLYPQHVMTTGLWNQKTDFKRRVHTEENCAVLRCYAASGGNFLQTFGTTYRCHLQGPRTKKLLDSWPLKTGPIICPETSVWNYLHCLRNNPEERSSHLLRGGNLKSRIVLLQLQCSLMTEGEQRRFGEPATKLWQLFSRAWRQKILPIDGSTYLPNPTVSPPLETLRYTRTLQDNHSRQARYCPHAIIVLGPNPGQGPNNPIAIRLPSNPVLHFTTHQTAGGKPHTISVLLGNSC